MESHNSNFNRIVLAVMIVLYLVSVDAFSYINWTVEPEHNVMFSIINFLILSIPLVLLYGSIYILLVVWREHQSAGTVSPRLARVIHWAPRIAALLIAFFVGLFSLDVFDMGGTLLQKIGAFIMHSLPTIFMLIMVLFAWRKPVVGFVGFLLVGTVFLRFVVSGGLMHVLLFSGPLLLVAALFYADWRLSKSRPAEAGTPA